MVVAVRYRREALGNLAAMAEGRPRRLEIRTDET